MTIWRVQYELAGGREGSRDCTICAPDPLQALIIDLRDGGEEAHRIRNLRIEAVAWPDCIIGIAEESISFDAQVTQGDLDWIAKLLPEHQPSETENERG